MSVPRVSVILPTRNRAPVLPRAMASVLNQSESDLELIVVDDASTDGTPEVVASWRDSRIVYLRNPHPAGDAGARNSGVARARGDWLAFQDSDDEWVPHSLARRLELASKASASHAAVASALARITPSAVQLVEWPLADGQTTEGEVDKVRFVATGRAYLQSMLVRRDAFMALGSFDTAFRARSDVDFCLRLIRRFGILAMTDVLALSYESHDSVSLDPAFRRVDIQRLVQKHLELIAVDSAVHARFLYDVARAELACDRRLDCVRAVAGALRFDPLVARAWALLLIAPLGARGLSTVAGLRRRLEWA